MRAGWLALLEGLRRLGHYWPALAVAYIVNLLSAAALAAFPALGLLEAARRPAMAQAARGISAAMVMDVLGAGVAGASQAGGAEAEALQMALRWMLGTALVLPMLAGLPAALLSGGVVLTYVEAPAPWRWQRFAWGCWRWLGSFILLGLGQAFVTALTAFAIAIPLGWAAFDAPWLAWALAALLAAILIFILMLFEAAGVVMISGASRNPFWALGETLRLLRGWALPLAVVYALALAALALAHAIYNYGLWPRLPLDAWPLVLLVQQAFIVFRLAARLLRLSAVATLRGLPSA